MWMDAHINLASNPLYRQRPFSKMAKVALTVARLPLSRYLNGGIAGSLARVWRIVWPA